MTTRRLAGLLALFCALTLAGCATPVPVPADASSGYWVGRLSVRVDADPVQSFAAGFELVGDARQGRLSLQTPFGATLAQLTWSPAAAQLQADGKSQSFASLDALTRHVVGTELPINGIFAWLRGEPADFSPWVTDGQDRAGGRLIARRPSPLPVVEMRLILE